MHKNNTIFNELLSNRALIFTINCMNETFLFKNVSVYQLKNQEINPVKEV